MKIILILFTGIVLVGCTRDQDGNPQMMAKLDAIQADLAKQSKTPPRWATVNKREIETSISQWVNAKTDQSKYEEKLSPEVKQKIASYDSLQSDLGRLQMRLMNAGGFPHRPMNYNDYQTNADYVVLTSKLAEARQPIAEVLQQRERLSSKLREQFKPADLVAEYAKERFDLVVDTSDAGFSHSPIVYQKTGDVIDITDGVIKLFKEKSN